MASSWILRRIHYVLASIHMRRMYAHNEKLCKPNKGKLVKTVEMSMLQCWLFSCVISTMYASNQYIVGIVVDSKRSLSVIISQFTI